MYRMKENHDLGAFIEGCSYHGFTLKEKRFVREVNAECLEFIHENTGARLFKIAANDPNKLFSITFKTLPENDCGTPHILEHSVLNGSKSFPVRSPFDVLLKGSLHTFLNAMTASDHTTYPVASMNLTDYFNLMHVYLDAVFRPMMHEDPMILKQEGWHYELNSPESPIIIKGVVYNEMKGAFSNPLYQLYYHMSKNLFPDNAYGFSSGGHPDAIPKLTSDYFSEYHRRYYHPSNSYILLYGDADLHRELEFIHEMYLKDFNRLQEAIELPLQSPFGELKTVIESYPSPEGDSLKDNTYLSLSFVANHTSERLESLALDIIVNAMVNHESAPVRLALQDAGIGKEVMGWFNEGQQNVINIIVQNANPNDMERFREIVFSALHNAVSEGFDKTTVEGIMNRNEFQLKEGDTPQKGLMYFDLMVQSWLFEDNPFFGLEYEEPLMQLKDQINSGLLENLTRKYLLENPHGVLLSMNPETGLQKTLDANLETKLRDYKKSLNQNEVDNLIRETQQLSEYQQKEDTPEALETIPMLKLSDIPENALFYELNMVDNDGIQIMHHDVFTNGIVYTSFYFDVRCLPQELIPYASLMTALLGKLSTHKYSYGDLENQINIHTGGFTSNLATFLHQRRDENLVPQLVVSAKAITGKTDLMLDLMFEILSGTIFTDQERLKQVIRRHHAQIDANIRQNGMNYAMNRAGSGYSRRGYFNEWTSGVEYYRVLTEITKNFDSKSSIIGGKLIETAYRLFSQRNLKVLVVCPAEDLESFRLKLTGKIERMHLGSGQFFPWNLNLERKNEAILSASQVQYVVKSFDFKQLGYEWTGHMHVLSQILSTDWLQNQIRVQGGAYGGFCGFAPHGNTYFASYRDPNLRETLAAIDATPGYIRNFHADKDTLTRYIIGTISNLDQPKTPSQKGSAAMHYFFEGTTAEMLNKERQEILSIRSEDIRGMAEMVEDILKCNNYCVYGNEGKIMAHADMFDGLIRIVEEDQ